MSWSSAGATCARAARGRRAPARAAGKPSRDAVIERASCVNSARRSGEMASGAVSVGLSCRAAGRSCVTSGSVSRRSAPAAGASAPTRARRSAGPGRARAAAGRAARWRRRRCQRCGQAPELPLALRERVVTRGRLDTAPRSAPDCEFRTSSERGGVLGERREVAQRVVEVARRGPRSRSPASCIQVWNARRVLGSNARKISSSSTVGDDRAVRRAARPRGSARAEPCPGVSST